MTEKEMVARKIEELVQKYSRMTEDDYARLILELARRHKRAAWARALLEYGDRALDEARAIWRVSQRELAERPRLQKVVWVAYKRHPYSLGTGCQALIVTRDGVDVDTVCGAYGAVMTI